jgi:DNA-binding NarL/FixJ family response regulator
MFSPPPSGDFHIRSFSCRSFGDVVGDQRGMRRCPNRELDALSERERDIIHLLALGYTNQEISKKLFISVRTVDTHRAHIMRKLQLETRAELVMFALANGVIGPNAD